MSSSSAQQASGARPVVGQQTTTVQQTSSTVPTSAAIKSSTQTPAHAHVAAGVTGAAAQQQTLGTSFRQDSHVITSTLQGLQATPVQPSVDMTSLHHDYLPKKHTQSEWLQTLVSKMEVLSTQIDHSAKQQQEEISAEGRLEIERLLAENQANQQQLIKMMHTRAHEYETEYQAKREAVIAQLDKEENAKLVKLQEELRRQQEMYAARTKEATDRINVLVQQKKLQVLGEAQKQQDSLSSSMTSVSSTVQPQINIESITKHHLNPNEKVTVATDEIRTETVNNATGEPSRRQQIA